MSCHRKFLESYWGNKPVFLHEFGGKDRLFSMFEAEYDFFVRNGLKADPNFDQELFSGNKEKFQQRVWEIALGNRFVRKGFNVSSQKEGPDFKITLPDGRCIWVEAVCPTRGTQEDAVPEFWNNNDQNDASSLSLPTEQIRLRWAHSIDVKSFIKNKNPEVIGRRYNNIIQRNEAYVIAINGALLTPCVADFYSMTQKPYVVDVTYGLGCLAVNVEREDCGGDNQWFLTDNNNLKKKGGGTVPTDFFLNKNMSHVSAIIGTSWNELACLDPKYQIEIGMVHNHLADVPIEPGLLRLNKEWWVDNLTNDRFNINHREFNEG